MKISLFSFTYNQTTRHNHAGIYNFIWNGKTDKVKRNIFEQDFKHGGYKMISLNDIVAAASVMWVQKYLDNNEREWKYTLEFFSKRKSLRMYLMSKFDVNELPTNMPCYYVNAIKEWSRLSSLSVGDVDKISAQPLWYNREIKIGFKTVYNENLFSIGMWYVGALFDEGNLLSFDTWVRRGANEADRLAWYGIVNCIYKKWNIHNVCDNPSTEPIILSCGLNVKTAFVNVENMTQKHVKMVLYERKRLSLEDSDYKYKIKHQLIQGFISDEEWKAIFLIPTLSPVENKIKDLQYKIIMRFVPTNYLLYKMKKVSSQTCTFCNLEPETIEHLFFQCIHVKDIWWYVFEEWAKLTGNTYEPNLRGCVLGVYNNNVDDTREINTIVLIVKAYIMKCKYEQSALSCVALARWFIYKVMVLSKLHDRDVFFKLSQMFAEMV